MEANPNAGLVIQQAQGEEEGWKKKKKMMKVMVAVDESAESFYALKWALDNLYCILGVSQDASDGGGGGIVTLDHVQQLFIPAGSPANFLSSGPGVTSFCTTSTMLESVRKAELKISADLISRALQVCTEKMMRAETVILDGDPKDMICEAVEQMHIGLLVVGSRGLGKIKRALLGSVSDYCAHHAACPVLIVKPPKKLRP